MSSPRRRSRRVPPKAPGPPSENLPGPAPIENVERLPSAAGLSGSAAGRPASRSANRAAKRATGVRPKTATRGRRGGRPARSSNSGLIALVVGAVVIGAAVLLIGNPFGTPAASPSPGTSPTLAAVQSHGDGTCPTSQPAPLAAADSRTVTIETPKGTIVMKIDGALAPIATANFVALVGCHFYDGIVFHRLVPGFVIQGGDPEGTGSGGPGYSIKDDPLTTTYRRGTVAMARTARPDSQGSQFFIVLSDDANAALTDPNNAPYPYAIMGEVTAGMDVVDTIAAMPNDGSSGNAALDPVPMTKVTVTGGPPGPSPAATQRPTTAPTAPPPSSAQ